VVGDFRLLICWLHAVCDDEGRSVESNVLGRDSGNFGRESVLREGDEYKGENLP
jgi:hypothetical protein